MDQLQVGQTATFQYGGAVDSTGAAVVFTSVAWALSDPTGATIEVDPNDQTQATVTAIAEDNQVNVQVTGTGPDGTVYTPAEIEDVAGDITPETTTYPLSIIAKVTSVLSGILKRLT